MRIVVLTLIVLCCASLVFGQIPGSISLYGDEQGTICSIPPDPHTNLITIHIFHNWTDGATGVKFKIELSGCLLGLTLDSPFFWIGSIFENTQIYYQECLSGRIYLGSILAIDETCIACAYVRVVKNTEVSPEGILVTDCSSPEPQLMVATGGELVYIPVPGVCECQDISTEDTTWGQVKALFE